MKGQTLIEALLAFSILGIILTGIVVSVTSSLNNSGYSKSQTLATQYAQEGIEVLRGIRDSNYNAFITFSGNYCLNKYSSTLVGNNCPTPNVDTFIRTVSIEQSGCTASVAKATVTVSWTDTKCSGGSYCRKSTLISCLSTINPIQAP